MACAGRELLRGRMSQSELPLASQRRVVYTQAMPRLREVSRDNATPFIRQIYQMLFGERDPVREPGTETGSPGNWWTVFALSPDCFRHAVLGFQLYRSADRKLDPKLRELGQLRAGWARSSRFVFSQHCKAARAVGLDEARVAAVPHWQTADVFTPSSAPCWPTPTAWCSTAAARRTA